eukprot:2470106-Alexandrium_andersonii.AAC.1
MEVDDGRVSPAPEAVREVAPASTAGDGSARAAGPTPGAGAADGGREREADSGAGDQMAGIGEPQLESGGGSNTPVGGEATHAATQVSRPPEAPAPEPEDAGAAGGGGLRGGA